MSRPTTACAKCVRETIPGCTHLGMMYDRYFARNPTATEQDLVVYALNRMWALERDNTHKAQGEKATRTYRSRNETVARHLANKCTATRGRYRCLRNVHGPEVEHKF